MDTEIDESEEYVLYAEFLELANAAAFGNVDDEDEYNISDESDQEFDFENIVDVVNDEQLMDVNDEIDESHIDIMQCIINMIEIEHILQNDFPEERRKSERRWGVHPLNQMRREHGHFHHLFEEMLAHDHDEFFNYTRMTPGRFQHLFELIETRITKKAPNAIPAKCRLLLTLWYFEIDGQFLLMLNSGIFSFLAIH